MLAIGHGILVGIAAVRPNRDSAFFQPRAEFAALEDLGCFYHDRGIVSDTRVYSPCKLETLSGLEMNAGLFALDNSTLRSGELGARVDRFALEVRELLGGQAVRLRRDDQRGAGRQALRRFVDIRNSRHLEIREIRVAAERKAGGEPRRREAALELRPRDCSKLRVRGCVGDGLFQSAQGR